MNNIPLGIGTPNDPLYGVLDINQNFFYLVTQRPEIVEKASILLLPHRFVETILISDASNWYYNQIDNTVCNNWGISYTPDKTCVNNLIEHSDKTGMLIKNLLYFMALYEKICYFKESYQVRYQSWSGMVLPDRQLCHQFNDDWLNQAVVREFDNYKQVCMLFEQNLDILIDVFDLDISIDDYQIQLESKLKTVAFDSAVWIYFSNIFYEF